MPLSGRRSSTEKPFPESKNSSPLQSKNQIGAAGENFVRETLLKQGYQEFRKNWRTPFGEVDLVMTKMVPVKEIMIIEVKTRQEKTREYKTQALGFRQRQRLARAARWIWSLERHRFKIFKTRLAIVTECSITWINLPLLYDQS